MKIKFQELTSAIAEVTQEQLKSIKDALETVPTPANIKTELMTEIDEQNVATVAEILEIDQDSIPHGYIVFHTQAQTVAKGLVGLKVFNSAGEEKGVVTDRYVSGTDDKDVLLIDDDWEVATTEVHHVLWTILPDNRNEHIRLK